MTNKKQDYKRELKRDMILVYGLVCWGDELWLPSNQNIITVHHILPVRKKGKLEWDNIALLSQYFHDFFNRIENVDKRLASELNDLFIELNRSMNMPTNQHYSDVDFLMNKAEYKHGIELRR